MLCVTSTFMQNVRMVYFRGMNLFQICEDAGNILAALEELSKIEFEELSIDEKLCLPYMRKE